MADTDQPLFETEAPEPAPPLDTEAIAESAGDRALRVAAEQEDRRARSVHSELGGGLSTARSERISRHIQTARQKIEESRPGNKILSDDDQRRRDVWDNLKAEYAKQDRVPSLLAYKIALYQIDPNLLTESSRKIVESHLDPQVKPSTQIHTGPLV